MKKIIIEHEIELIFIELEPFRGERLERVINELKKVLHTNLLCKIKSIQDSKGQLIITVNDSNNIDDVYRYSELICQNENECDISLVIEEENFPF